VENAGKQQGEIVMTLQESLKHLLIEELNLEDIEPSDIKDDEPLFGEGLGLDSLDAVELVVIVEKHFDVAIKNMDEGRVAFRSIDSLAAFIEERKSQCPVAAK
jgi:acyl carrier protein